MLARAEHLLQQITKAGKNLAPHTDAQLGDLASGLRERAREGERLDDLLVDTYALVREVAERTVGMRPFDVQILGAIALHGGSLAEMKTGEGKTLAATLPLVLNALTGGGAHLVTVNDYLAERDAEWMGPIYRFMGLSVGVVTEDLDDGEQGGARKLAYAAVGNRPESSIAKSGESRSARNSASSCSPGLCPISRTLASPSSSRRSRLISLSWVAR